MNSVYQHPDDIDLWLGGLLESARGDGIVGPTFGDIIADQFSKFRQGDRYFYEHAPEINPGAFTPDQLAQIKKVTMARLICDNSDALQEQPPKAFVQVKVAGYDFATKIQSSFFFYFEVNFQLSGYFFFQECSCSMRPASSDEFPSMASE